MSNLPIVLQEGGSNPPVLPENLLVQYKAFADQMIQGFQGSFNRIKVGKMDFTLVEGGNSRRVENGQVIGVFLGMSPIDYCSWYEKNYAPGQEPEAPDLVWNWPDHDKFPDALPVQYRQKKNRSGQDRWDFRIARRSVMALVQPHPETGQFFLNTETPYIFDVTSASLYGNSDTKMNWYKWSGLIQMCNRFSQLPNFVCSPAMFLTRLRIDPTATVSGVVYFEPLFDKSGNLMYLDSVTFTGVVEAMQSQQVKDMLQVKEILEWPKSSTAQPSTPSVPSEADAQTASSPVSQEAPQNTVAGSEQFFAATHQPAPTQTAPPMQAATAEANPTLDADTQSRLARAQSILGAVGTSATAGAAQAKPAASTKPNPTAAPANVNPVTAEAIRSFGDLL